MSNKIAVILFFLFVFAGTSYAAGKMVIKPVLFLSTAYESNYFSSLDNERAVISHHIQPGLEFGYTTAKSNLLFNYSMDATWYDEEGSTPAGETPIDEYDYIGHGMTLNADTQITDRLNIGIDDTYNFTRDARLLDTYSNETTKQKFSNNSLTPKLFYQFGEKFGFGVEYTFSNVDYSNAAQEDSDENRGSFNLIYNMNSLNSLDLQFQYWKKDYSKNTPDYISHQTMLTFARKLKYYTLSAGAGYQNRSFGNSTQKDLEGFVWNLSISGDRPQFSVSIAQNYNDTAVDNNYYVATRLNASVGHLFLKKLNVKLQGYYQNSEYHDNASSREDDTWSISTRLDYIRNDFFSLGLESGLGARESSLSGNDYENSYVLIEIKLNLNLGSK